MLAKDTGGSAKGGRLSGRRESITHAHRASSSG
jgi:hypothetical protein